MGSFFAPGTGRRGGLRGGVGLGGRAMATATMDPMDLMDPMDAMDAMDPMDNMDNMD
jgi:hypothetical protein